MLERGYSAIYAIWEGVGFPNNLKPSPSQPELSFDEWCKRLAAAGTNLIRHKFVGWNHVLGSQATGIELRMVDGQPRYNDWGGRLQEAVTAALEHGVKWQAICFDNREFVTGWGLHAWNTRNGGFLTDPRDVFTNPKAIDCAKQRIQHIVSELGDTLSKIEIMAEASFCYEMVPDDAPHSEKVQLAEELAAWTQAMAVYAHSITGVPIGGGQVFSATHSFSPDPNHWSNVRNQMFQVPALDYALINWYGDGAVRNKLTWLRKCQQFTGKRIYVEQYAPWDLGRNAPYTREPADFSESRTHEWTALCAEFGVVGPLRWIESKPSDEFATWWGVASPEMAQIAGTTAQYAAVVDLDDWSKRGQAWETRITSTDLAWTSAWGDGSNVCAFLNWSLGGAHAIRISGLADGDYRVPFFDYITGDEVSEVSATATGGVLNLENVPHRDNRCVLYASTGTEPPIPPDPDPELEERVEALEQSQIQQNARLDQLETEMSETFARLDAGAKGLAGG